MNFLIQAITTFAAQVRKEALKQAIKIVMEFRIEATDHADPVEQNHCDIQEIAAAIRAALEGT